MKTRDIESLTKDLEKMSVPLRPISRNSNVHGGFVVYDIDEPYCSANPACSGIVLKSSRSSAALAGELCMIRNMQTKYPIGAHGVGIVRPALDRVVESADRKYILLEKAGECVADSARMIGKEMRQEILDRLARFTALSNITLGYIEQGTDDYGEYLKYRDRLMELASCKEDSGLIKDSIRLLDGPMRCIYAIFSALPRVYRKDPKLENWHFSKDFGQVEDLPQITAIDWEYGRTQCPPEFEMSKLLYQGNHANDLTPEERVEVMKAYLEEFYTATGAAYASLDEFSCRTHLASVPKAFAFMSYAFDKPHLREDVGAYLENAGNNLDCDSLEVKCAGLEEGMALLRQYWSGKDGN